MYEVIMVPLDGSKRAERILPHVEELAHRFASKVVFLQVLDHGAIIQRPQGSPVEIEILEEQQDQAANYLAGWKGEFREKGIRAKSVVEHGSIVSTIIDVAEREHANLIAMASHGRSGLPQVFYGSVAAGVLHRIDRPLLLIRSI